MKTEERKSETRRLIREWQENGDVEARNKAVMLNEGLVVKYISSLPLHYHITRDDDYQQAILGLIRAINKFDFRGGSWSRST